MPSLHVAMATLMWCAMRPVHRLAGPAYFVFLACILLGSVHLGWHYALDGYVSILLVCILWWLSGRLVTACTVERRSDRISASSMKG
jgi:membrane-associated phospholipid phosphatase